MAQYSNAMAGTAVSKEFSLHGVVIVDPGFIQSPSYDLPTLMSKFMALGVGRDKVIEMVIAWPAQVFDYGVALGALKPGTDADIGIFEAREESF